MNYLVIYLLAGESGYKVQRGFTSRARASQWVLSFGEKLEYYKIEEESE